MSIPKEWIQVIKREMGDSTVLVYINKELTVCGQVQIECREVFTILLREHNLEWFLHELAHCVEILRYGSFSNHELQFMNILEDLEDKYL